MNDKPLPTRKQIVDVRRLLWTGMYTIPTISHMTGVPLRDVFRIEKSIRKQIDCDT